MIFVQGDLVGAQFTISIPVALSITEYTGACNIRAIVCHLQDLKYNFDNKVQTIGWLTEFLSL